MKIILKVNFFGRRALYHFNRIFSDLIVPKLEEIAKSINWELVGEIWATNQPFVRLRGTNCKRRGQKHVYTTDNDKDITTRKATVFLIIRNAFFAIIFKFRNYKVDLKNN